METLETEPFSEQLPSEITYSQLSNGNGNSGNNHGTGYNNGGNGNGNSYGVDGNQGNGKGNTGTVGSLPLNGEWLLLVFLFVYTSQRIFRYGKR